MRLFGLRFVSVFSVFISILNGTANAQIAVTPGMNYFTVQETLPEGSVRFKIIAEDSTLRAHQNQISQDVIYKTIFEKKDLPINVNAILTKVLKEDYLTPGKNLIHSHTRFPMTALPLWVPIKNAWEQTDEDAYSAWFAEQTTDFNQDTGLIADCADTGLLFRWVYARQNLLPIANSLSGSGKLFGHFSSNAAWDALPTNADWKQDERFKAAMRYLFNNSYTRTVVSDIYPTVISPAYVRPGSMFMIIRPTDGHTQTVHDVNPNYGIITFWGNEPASESVFESALLIEIQNKMTIGMWRQPRQVTTSSGSAWELIPANQMPGYSTAQFSQVFNSNGEMNDWLNSQLGVHETDSARLQVLEKAFEQGLQMRLLITAESIPFCIVSPCSKTSANYDNYSTFSRDAKLISEQQEIAGLITKMGPDSSAVNNFEQNVGDEGEVIEGSGLTYLALVTDPTLLPKLNSDPRVSYEARWGISQATPDPTLQFYTLSQALFSLLKERQTEVVNGYYTCLKGTCTPNSATLNALNTSHLDGGIKLVIDQTLAAAAATGVDPAALANVHQTFRHSEVYNINADCSDTHTYCTFDDIVWAPDAATHFNAWSPNATDSINSRWGYSD
jgi:hypothetical protein